MNHTVTTCACQQSRAVQRTRGQMPKRRLLIHATKVAYPKVHPCFFTSQRFAYLLLITELHVTIVRLSHGTCSTPLSKSVCKSPSILLTKCSTRFIKSPGDYVKPCKISRPQWVNPCFIFSKFTENCIYIYVFICVYGKTVNMKIEIETGSWMTDSFTARSKYPPMLF